MKLDVPIEEIFDHTCMMAIREMASTVHDKVLILNQGKVHGDDAKFFLRIASLVMSGDDKAQIYVHCGRLSWLGHRLAKFHGMATRPQFIDKNQLYIPYFDMDIVQRRMNKWLRETLKHFGYEKEAKTYTVGNIYRLYYKESK